MFIEPENETNDNKRYHSRVDKSIPASTYTLLNLLLVATLVMVVVATLHFAGVIGKPKPRFYIVEPKHLQQTQ